LKKGFDTLVPYFINILLLLLLLLMKKNAHFDV